MRKTMTIKPAPGLSIRHPQTMQRIPETGIEVSDTDPYWARRLADGDVVLVKPAPSPTKSKE